jgi:hypothetical protein
MSISEYLKPAIGYSVSILTEMRDTALLSLYLAIPAPAFTGLSAWISVSSNVDFLRIVLTAIAIDHILGSLAHSRYFKDDFSLIKNIGGLGIKILVVITMGSLFNDLATLTKNEDFIYKYLLFVTHILIFLYPARSAMRNCFIISGKRFPPKLLMEKTDDAFNNLDIKAFKKSPEQKTEEL